MRPLALRNLCWRAAILSFGFLCSGQIYSFYRQTRPLFLVNQDQIKEDLQQAKNNTNEITGWPSFNFSSKNLDKRGFRKYLQSPINPCLEIYGGSYAYSFNSKSQEDSWSAELGNKLKCDVLNYAIPGFGIDQAVLRHNKYSASKNVSLLLYVDDSLKRIMQPMLSLTYDGISRSYVKNTFKPVFVFSESGLLLKQPNSQSIYKKILRIRQDICLGPTSFLCIAREVLNNAKKSIGSKGLLYQRISGISPSIANSLNLKFFNYRKDFTQHANLKLHIEIARKYLENCKTKKQICLISRFPEMIDVSYPDRISLNILEEKMNNEFTNNYIPSLKTAKCMRNLLGSENHSGRIDLSVMKYQDISNKHYLKKADVAFANCISPFMVNRIMSNQ